MADLKMISREELKAKLDRGDPLTILEVLPEAAYRFAHIPGAINMPKDKVRELAPKLLPDKSAEIVTYCASVT
jgi:rhodanese-related sulfurtransferase